MWTPHDVAEWLYMQARALPYLLDAAKPRSPALDKLAARHAGTSHQPPSVELPAAAIALRLLAQNTKDDYTHTFLVHSIDGPALIGLTREQLLLWKVKPIDASSPLVERVRSKLFAVTVSPIRLKY